MINKCQYNPTYIFAYLQLVLTHHMTEYPLPKNWGMSKDIPRDISQSSNLTSKMENSVFKI